MHVGNDTSVFLARQNHYLGVEYADQNANHMIDNERVYYKHRSPMTKKLFEKPRGGYITQDDKIELQKVKNLLYGHINVEKLAQNIKKVAPHKK